MLAIFKREVRAYFLSPIAYVFIGAFLVLSDIFFMLGNIFQQQTNFNYTLGSLQLVLLFVVPILTMKLIADERKTKTDQLLLTSPVSVTGIVVGKYLAALFVFFVTLVISLVYPIILFAFGHPSLPELINAYIGFFLLGAAFIAVCVFASSLTDNQVIAAIIGFASLLSLWMIEWIGQSVRSQLFMNIISWLSLLKRYGDFMSGILRPGPIIYYISFSVLFIFLAIRAIEKRRWSEG